MVAIHPCAGLLGCVDASDTKSHGASAVDNAGEQQARAEPATLGDGVTHGRDEFKFVAAIADSRDSRCEIDRSPFHLLEVGVHIPEAGQDGILPLASTTLAFFGILTLERGPTATMRPSSITTAESATGRLRCRQSGWRRRWRWLRYGCRECPSRYPQARSCRRRRRVPTKSPRAVS